MTNFERIKEILCSTITSMTEDQLFEFISMYKDEKNFFPEEALFTCEKCHQEYGECEGNSLSTENYQTCKKRFEIYCGAEDDELHLKYIATYTFHELFENNILKEITQLKGIYKILIPTNFEFILTSTTDAKDGKEPFPVDELQTKWDSIADHSDRIVYIGKADNLRRRIRQYTKHGYGLAKNHTGGRAIWQLKNNKELLVSIYTCAEIDDPEVIESMLLDEYEDAHNNTLPFANGKHGKYQKNKKK